MTTNPAHLKELMKKISSLTSQVTEIVHVSHKELTHLESFIGIEGFEKHSNLISKFNDIVKNIMRYNEDKGALGISYSYEKIYSLYTDKLFPVYCEICKYCSYLLLLRPKDYIWSLHLKETHGSQMLQEKINLTESCLEPYEKSLSAIETYNFFESGKHLKPTHTEKQKSKREFALSSPFLFGSFFIWLGGAGGIIGLIWFDYKIGIWIGGIISLLITIGMVYWKYNDLEVKYYLGDFWDAFVTIFLIVAFIVGIILFFVWLNNVV